MTVSVPSVEVPSPPQGPTPTPGVGPSRPDGRPEPAITRQVFGQLWKGALTLGLTFGAVAASSALSYASTYPTRASRLRVAASIRGDGGLAAFFGQLDRIDTVGGYTAYKSFVFLSTIGAIWAVLATTRLLRGEEDAGRWQLVLAGRTHAVGATRATLAGIGGALLVVFGITVASMLVTGARPSLGLGVLGCVTFGASTVVAPAVFAALAAVASQVARTRRLATAIAMAGVGLAFVLRMVGDSGSGSRWLLWATPFGWVELTYPFTTDDPRPLVLAGVAVTGLLGMATALAGRRDVGGGMLATREVAPARSFGLGSPLGLTMRLSGPIVGAWAVGITATSVVFGIVARIATDSLAASSSAGTTLAKLGASGRGPTQYLGVVFLLTGAVLALFPAGQVNDARREEASGRLSYLVAGPPSRTRWLAGRLALTTAAVLAMGTLAGFATWVGAASQGVEVELGGTVLAGVNTVPAGLLALGIGALALALVPRMAPALVYLVVAWSLIVDLLGSLVSGLDVLTVTSLFHYVALAPSEPVNWLAAGCMTGVAGLLAVSAVVVFGRRDLTSD